MKIRELLETLRDDVKNDIFEIRVDGVRFENNKEFNRLGEFDVKNWGITPEGEKLVLVLHGVTFVPEESEETELTVSDVLENINFDEENTIIVYGKTGQTLYDSDEDDVVVLCEFLGLDVKEYVQIHRGSHQTIEINLKNYN